MQDITEWTNTSITHSLSRAAGHPIVQVDDDLYSQIFSLCSYLDHFPPLSPFIASCNYLSVYSVTTGLKLILGLASSFPIVLQESSQARREVEAARKVRKPTHSIVTVAISWHFLHTKSFQNLSSATSRLLTENIPSARRTWHKFAWPWSLCRHLPSCLCSKCTQTFSLPILYSYEVETEHRNLIKHLIMFQKAF